MSCSCMLLLQETNISQVSDPSFSNQVHRRGWQLLHVPPPTAGHKGGAAILTREPLSLVQLHVDANGGGQLVIAELLGYQRPVMIGSLYRHGSDTEFETLHRLSTFLDAHNGRDFIIGLDGNASMSQGPVFDMFTYHHAICGAQARHIRSREPMSL